MAEPAPDIGEGWTVSVVERKGGKLAGKEDRYWHSPGGKRFRSVAEINRFKVFLAAIEGGDEDKALNAMKAARAKSTRAPKQKKTNAKKIKGKSSPGAAGSASETPGSAEKKSTPVDTATALDAADVNMDDSCHNGEVPIGEVGYTFRKQFPGHGIFEGRVVKIRPGAEGGKDRRCVYSDGDREDLSLSQLRSLAASYPKSGSSVGRGKKRKEDCGENKAKKKKACHRPARPIQKSSKGDEQKHRATKSETKDDPTNVPFSGLNDHIPIDMAAEVTLQAQQRSGQKKPPIGTPGSDRIDAESSEDIEEQETGMWLEKVASMLGAGVGSKGVASRSRKVGSSISTSRSMSPVPPTDCGGSNMELVSESFQSGMAKKYSNGQSSWGVTDNERRQMLGNQIPHRTDPPTMLAARSASPSSSVSMDCPVSLADVKRGARHGTKVFRVDDKKRVVGEVILEHGSGYVEVVIAGSIEKARIRRYVVAPSEYSIGDSVSPSLQLLQAETHGAAGASRSCSSRRADGKTRNATPSRRQVSRQDTPLQSNVLMKTTHSGRLPDGDNSMSVPEKNDLSSSTHATVSIDTLFYWCCPKCTMANGYNLTRCVACDAWKTARCKQSPLLEIADTAVAAASSVDDALELVPIHNRDALPKIVLFNLFSSSKRADTSRVDSYPVPSESLDSYFYWMCGFCTMKNSYRRSKCVSCNQRKSPGCTLSVVLDIATKASKKARTVCDALSSIPCEQRKSIPEAVLSSLVTCIAVVGRKNDQHRCLRSKAPGEEYCSFHLNDPLVHTRETCDNEKPNGATTMSGDCSPHSCANDGLSTAPPSPRKHQEPENRSLVAILDDMAHSFSRQNSVSFTNKLQWNVRSAEDAILCQETGPFPVGMYVRRFFTHFGFHDGRIVKVLRREILDEEMGTSRPVLIYRVLYNDGDCEDFMHHEINSLRQIYDRCGTESKECPHAQIKTGALFETQTNGGIIKIVNHTTPPEVANQEEGGIVHVKFCKIGHPWTDLKLDIKQLQTSVVRMLPPSESVAIGPAQSLSCVDDEEVTKYDASISMGEGGDKGPAAVTASKTAIRTFQPQPKVLSPVLEWPDSGRPISTVKDDPSAIHGERFEISPELSLSRTACKSTQQQVLDEDEDHIGFMDDESCVRQDVSQTGWDPANALDYISWDPYKSIVCAICEEDKDDHQILICDECHLGYHMYCVRPVIVNVPTTEWFCSQCTTGRGDSKRSFPSFLTELQNKPKNVLEFLGLEHEDLGAFPAKHKEGLDLFSPQTPWSKRQAAIGVNSRSKATAKIGSLFFSWNIQKNDWVIPMPLSCSVAYGEALSSWVAAMQFVGMTSYSEELIYPNEGGLSAAEEMNDANLDLEGVQPLSQRNLDIFNEYKENLRQGAYPPIRIVHDKDVGFTVEALATIRKHTLIAEYVGEVTTVERSGETSSDSLMMLLDTGDESTSLIIDPTRTGNIARFLSGINNRSLLSRKKANVRTRRFALNGKCRVALFTAKRIESGEKLHYDYNAGVEGKTVLEWAQTGFYDTSNFF